ncbi:uncharacterized protein LOC109861908 isoform X2 [Pseudomyrmex gracilis]|uniref:uncharacterized protein LOC109861908 isoform X2 n=1 Tax=Pseudomyrmex gracilis TaxID=219809 RepID=UPI000994BA78|nr:uncharacterized protein LOC109861908 isoform X2 [Pseudomyrmex gracilis]
MAKSIDSILLLTFVLFAQAEELNFERWNTPPELTPESVVKTSGDEKSQTRLFSLVPVAATVSLNAGHNNAHSVSLGASLDGISLSGSNSYIRPAGNDGSSGSQSATISAGLSGISAAGAEAHNNGNNVKSESHSLGFGQATATSFGTIENGQAITGAASSVGASQSVAASGGNRGQSFSKAVGVQYQNRPVWNNVGPNYWRNDRPTLMISKPYDGTWPQLHVGVTNRREQKPTVHIYKWHPNRGLPTRPGLSIEQQIHNSWNDRSHGSTGLQIGVGSSSSPHRYSSDDSASRINGGPLNIAFSSSGRVYTSGGARGRAQSWRSFERPSEGFSAEDRSEVL